MANRGGAVLGNNPTEMRALAAKFDQSATDINNIVSTLTSQLNSTTWMGPDAQRFETDWMSVQAPNLRRAVVALNTGAADLRRNADAQVTTSSQ